MRLIERTEYLDPLKRVRNIRYQGNNRNSSFRKVQIIRLFCEMGKKMIIPERRSRQSGEVRATSPA